MKRDGVRGIGGRMAEGCRGNVLGLALNDMKSAKTNLETISHPSRQQLSSKDRQCGVFIKHYDA